MSFSAFNARYHKEGLISVSSFNNYTNDKYICFEDDMIYDDMEKNFRQVGLFCFATREQNETNCFRD